MSTQDGRPVGYMRDCGFELGVQRTLRITVEQAWKWLTSSEGVAAWLTQVDKMDFCKGATYIATDGSNGVVRGFKRLSHLDITYHPPDWDRPSTIQVRVTAKGERTDIAFNEEDLFSYAAREQRLVHYRAAFKLLEASLTM